MSGFGRVLPHSALKKNPICWEYFDFVIGACSYSVTHGVLEDEEPNFGLTTVSQIPALGLISPTSSYN
jgi:hypothetical protein